MRVEEKCSWKDCERRMEGSIAFRRQVEHNDKQLDLYPRGADRLSVRRQ